MSGRPMVKLIEEALSAGSENSSIEFKESFDPQSAQDWCELVKDIVAIANTKGGAIVFGVNDDGEPMGFDVNPVLQIDPAEFTDKIYRYTGFQFSQFQMVSFEKNGHTLAALLIDALPLPLVFEKPGTYDIGQGKQRSAFSAGAVYFRHGAKSEPGNTNDLTLAFEHRLEQVRENWLKNVRQVIEAPLGSTVITIEPSSDLSALPVRLSDDPNAPLISAVSPDTTHPYRQKELMDAVNQRLPEGVRINQYDVLCIRRLHDIDGKRTFHYLPKFGGHQYSPALADWIIQQYDQDKEFFTKSRQMAHDQKVKKGK